MTRQFQKPSLTFHQQIEHLRSAGMTVSDPAEAEHWLERVSYYRLSGYWHIWKIHEVATTRFQQGATFTDACALYSFDRKLRRLVGRALEHVEVALRGSWAYSLAHRGGSHGYLDAALYRNRRTFHEQLGKLASGVGQSSETYILHYRENYDHPAMPAVWMVAEMMTFGQLSRWTSLLADPALRQEIADRFVLREGVFVSVIKHLVDVRNICAHHHRLWNRGFRSPPQLPRRPADLAASLNRSGVGHEAARLYNSLVLLVFLMRQVAPDSTWRGDLLALLDSHPTGDLAAMGFPADWRTRPLWV